jgi:hypothetical protein
MSYNLVGVCHKSAERSHILLENIVHCDEHWLVDTPGIASDLVTKTELR